MTTNKFRCRLELHSDKPRQVLAAATDVCVKGTLNNVYYVTFTYPKLPDDYDRYDALIEENEVHFPLDVERGQHFVIKRVDEVRKGLRIYKHVEAHHIAANLNRFYLDEFIDFAADKPPSFLLAKLSNGTPYTMTVNGSYDNQDVFDFGEKRRNELLSNVAALYGGELSYNNYEITLTTRKGANYGSEIRYRKNLTGITRKSHNMERVTRLYGYGKAGLTIEGYGGNTVKYIDSAYIDPAHVFEGSVDFPEIEDQSALLDAMRRHLTTVELPKVSYEIDFVQLEKVDGDLSQEAIREVGDTVTVIDESLGYRFDARVTDFERYPFEPKRGRVILANFRELKTSDYIWQATVASKRAMVYTSDNAVLRGVKYDDSITLVDGFGMSVSDDLNRTRVRIGQTGPGDYGFAAYNKAGAKTIWLDATTGDGRFNGTLEAPVIIGGNITGGTITGSTLQTGVTGQRIVIDMGGLRAYDNLGTKRIDIELHAGAGHHQLQFSGQNGTRYGVISATNGQLNVAAGNGGNIIIGTNDSGGIYLDAPVIDFQNNPVIQFPITNVTGLSTALGGKANISEAGYNLAFDPATRNLKMYDKTGTVMASVTIPV